MKPTWVKLVEEAGIELTLARISPTARIAARHVRSAIEGLMKAEEELGDLEEREE